MVMSTPLPAPYALPQPYALPGPSATMIAAGSNPYAPTNSALAPGPLPFSPPSPSLANSLQQQVTMAALKNGGMPMDGDPNAWTPEQAATQTANGIAKLATTNPELAQQLADKWQGGGGDDDGGGLFGALKNLAGDLFHPFLSVGGKVLDYIGRSANIVPNIVFDMADGGGFSLGDDVGGAISGNLRHNWNSVFQEMGWEGGGLSGLVRAGLGFVGDVATDPLTWLIPAGELLKAGKTSGSLSKALTVATFDAEKLATYEGGAELVKQFGVHGVAEHITNFLSMAEDIAATTGEKLGMDSVERYAGQMAVGVKDSMKGILADAAEIQANAYTALSKGSHSIFKAGKVMGLQSGRTVTGETLREAAKGIISKGTGSELMKTGFRLKGAGKEAYDLAQLAKSGLGGVRLGLQVPFTTFRYITPFSMTFGRDLPFTAARRFFSGYSGITKLISAAERAGTPEEGAALWKSVKMWQESGWKAFKKEAPEIAERFQGRTGMSIGSGYRSLSDEMGRLTMRFDPYGAARSGIHGYYAKAGADRARTLQDEFVRDTMSRLKTADGKTLEYGDILNRLETDLHVSKRPRGDNSATQEMRDEMAEWTSGMPIKRGPSGEVLPMTPDEIDAAFWSNPYNQGLKGEALARKQDELAHLHELDAKFTPQQKETMGFFRELQSNGRSEAGKHDVFSHDVTGEFSDSGLIHRSRLDRWQEGTDATLTGRGRAGAEHTDTTWYITPENAAHAKDLQARGITSEADISNIHSEKLHDTDVEVAVKGGNPISIDNSRGATRTDQDLLDLADAEAQRGIDQAGNTVPEAYDLPDTPLVREPVSAATRQDMRHAYLQAERPDACGVFTMNADGTRHLTMFDPENVKVISANAPSFHASNQGWFHRTFDRRLQAFLRGAPDSEAKTKLLKQVGDPQSMYPRELGHLSLRESADEVRAALERQGLHYDGPIWNTNIMEVHDIYSRRLGEDIAAEHLGQVSRRITSMMDLSPGMLGHPISKRRWEWDIPRGTQKALARGDKRVLTAVAREAKKRAERDEAEHLAISKSVDRYLGLEAAVIEGLSAEETTKTILGIRLRRAVDTLAEGKVALNEERRVAQEAHDSAAESLARSSAARDEMDAANGFERRQVPVPDRRVETGTPPKGTPERRGDAFDRGETLDEAVARRVEEKPSFEVVPEDGKFRVKSKDYADRERFSQTFDTEAEADAYAKQANETVARTMELSVRENLAKDVGRYTGPPDAPPYEATYFDDLAARGDLWRNPDGKLVTTLEKKRGAVKILPVEAEATRVVEFKTRIDELRELDKTIFKGTESEAPLPVMGPRTVKKLGATPENAQAAADAAVGQAKRVVKQSEPTMRKLGAIKAQLQQAVVERNRAYAAMKGAESMPQMALRPVARGLEGWTPLHVRGLEGLAMPDYVAAEFHHIVDKVGVTGVRKLWREHVLNWWKRWATYRWPGFHIRNFFGAFFNNMLGGVGMMHDTFAWRVIHQGDKLVDSKHFERFALDKLGFDSRATYGDVASFLGNEGIGRANTTAVAFTHVAADEMEQGARHGNPVMQLARGYDKRARSFGSGVENFHRTAAWARGMEVTGGDAYGARQFVMVRHGDYSDLTTTEDNVRDLIPFYKWMRTNTPYQLRMLVENPEAMTLPYKISDFAYAAQGLDRQAIEADMPAYMKSSAGGGLDIPLPKLPFGLGSDTKNGAIAHMFFDLPYTDLYKGLSDYMSSFLPIVSNIAQSYGFKKNLFTQRDLGSHMRPLSGVFNAIPGVPSILDALGIAKRGADGNLYVSDVTENMLTAWPVYSRFRNFMLSDNPDTVESRAGALASMLMGVQISKVSAGDAASADIQFFAQEVAPVLAQMRDMGVVFPTADDFAASGLSFSSPETPSADSLFPSGTIAA